MKEIMLMAIWLTLIAIGMAMSSIGHDLKYAIDSNTIAISKCGTKL